MHKSALAPGVLLLSLLIVSAFAQEGTQPKAPATVPEILTRVGTSYEAGRYSACMSELREALKKVMAERVELIRDALPGSSEGLEKVPSGELSNEDLEGTSTAETLALAVGTLVKQTYRGGTKSIKVTLTVDSALLLNAGADKLSKLIEKRAGFIQYGTRKGVFTDKGSGKVDLELLIDNSMMRIESLGLTRDELFAFMDPKTVDALAAAIAK